MNVFSHLPFKILAFLSAVFFWFFLVIFQNVIVDLEDTLAIEVRNQPEGMEVVEELPEVTLRIAAPKEQTSFIRSSDFEAYIDFNEINTTEGTLEVHVTSTRNDVTIVSHLPAEVNVTLEIARTEPRPLTVEIDGNVASGYHVTSVDVASDEIEVVAPMSILENVDRVAVNVVLNGESESFDAVGSLSAFDREGELIDYSFEFIPEEINYSVIIGIKPQTKKVPVEAVFAEDVDTSRAGQIVFSPSVVEVTGSSDALNSTDSVQTRVMDRDFIESVLTGEREFINLAEVTGLTYLDNAFVRVSFK